LVYLHSRTKVNPVVTITAIAFAHEGEMAAFAYSDSTDALSPDDSIMVQDEAPPQAYVPNLRLAAIRNTYGQAYADSFATNSLASYQPAETQTPTPEPHPIAPPASVEKSYSAIHPTFVANDTSDLPAPVRAKALDWQRRQQSLVTTTNWRLATGCQAVAWSIVPTQLFHGELGRFLILACDFHAYGPENTMLLPTMAAGEQQLGLPRHPLIVSEQHLQSAKQYLMALRGRVAVEHRRAQTSLQSGDLSHIYARAESKAKYCKELSSIVKTIADAQLGRGTHDAHSAQFGAFIAQM
jgi:hypothetical protein